MEDLFNSKKTKNSIKKKDLVFKKCTHPLVDFLWFLGIICFCVAVRHPFYLGLSLFAGILFNIFQKNWHGLKLIIFCVPVFIFLSALNPLVSHWGETVLFLIFDKPFTKEAFFYGLNMGLVFLVMFEWFLCFGCVMTVDKFTYLFAPVFPSVSLMMVMILRLVPFCIRRGREISDGRCAIGLKKSTFKQKFSVLNAVMSSILEDGVMTALSMEKRGYGTARRTSFLNYRWRFSDFFELFFLSFCAFFVVCGIKNGNCAVNFYPVINFSKIFANLQSAETFFAFAGFLFLPMIIKIFSED